MVRHLEIEYKYDGSFSTRRSFADAIEELQLEYDFTTATGMDTFFYDSDRPDEFGRYRTAGGFQELTLKQKMCRQNNVVRIEHNLRLRACVTPESVQGMFSAFGFCPVGSLAKTSDIYRFEKMVISWYFSTPVASSKGKTRYFVEIEANADYNWKSIKQALKYITSIEKKLQKMNVIPKQRINESLFEIYFKSKTKGKRYE